MITSLRWLRRAWRHFTWELRPLGKCPTCGTCWVLADESEADEWYAGGGGAGVCRTGAAGGSGGTEVYVFGPGGEYVGEWGREGRSVAQAAPNSRDAAAGHGDNGE